MRQTAAWAGLGVEPVAVKKKNKKTNSFSDASDVNGPERRMKTGYSFATDCMRSVFSLDVRRPLIEESRIKLS
jgi:hypothetical protein